MSPKGNPLEKQQKFYDFLKDIKFESGKESFQDFKADICGVATKLARGCADWEAGRKGRVTKKHLENIRANAEKLSNGLNKNIGTESSYNKEVEPICSLFKKLAKALKDASTAIYPHMCVTSTLDYDETRKHLRDQSEKLLKTTCDEFVDRYVRMQADCFWNKIKGIEIKVDSNQETFIETFNKAMETLHTSCTEWAPRCRNATDRNLLKKIGESAKGLYDKMPKKIAYPVKLDDKDLLKGLRNFCTFLRQAFRERDTVYSFFYYANIRNKIADLHDTIFPTNDFSVQETANYFVREFSKNAYDFFQELKNIKFDYGSKEKN